MRVGGNSKFPGKDPQMPKSDGRLMLEFRLKDKRSAKWVRSITKLKDVISTVRQRQSRIARKISIAEGEVKWSKILTCWTPLIKRERWRRHPKALQRLQDEKYMARRKKEHSYWKPLKHTFAIPLLTG
ncbi:unnamed protein product [Cylicostephanus goldi]|uniref:Uncharacterized protein n=1 Tax=Cylicostephanus goldi TaxID=71465 RepID=A0A3P7MBN4_CYLGO|nr:unnamed protein product [Cylicostephanus goldi]